MHSAVTLLIVVSAVRSSTPRRPRALSHAALHSLQDYRTLRRPHVAAQLTEEDNDKVRQLKLGQFKPNLRIHLSTLGEDNLLPDGFQAEVTCCREKTIYCQVNFKLPVAG